MMGGFSWFEGLMYDTEAVTEYLKAGVACMWANLTSSQSEKAETRYWEMAARVALDQVTEKTARKPPDPFDEGQGNAHKAS
jgi:hypothetical protein